MLEYVREKDKRLGILSVRIYPGGIISVIIYPVGILSVRIYPVGREKRLEIVLDYGQKKEKKKKTGNCCWRKTHVTSLHEL